MPAVGNVITGNGTVPAGGTTGQVLSKVNATDYNLQWSTSAITIAGTSTSLGGSITQDTITGLSASAGLVKHTASANTLALATAKTDYWDTTNFVASGASAAKGLAPAPSTTAGTTAFLCEDATWKVPAGGGNVSNSGTPSSGQSAQWISSTAIKGVNFANYQGAVVTGPISQSTTAGLMVGLAGAITPTATGRVLVTINGTIRNDTANSGGVYSMRWGTSTAPILNAALTGTAIGGSALVGQGTYGANSRVPFSLSAVITGLTLNVAIWIDLQGAAVTSGNAILSNTSICAIEIL